VAAAFGAHGEDVVEESQLGGALERAKAAGKPACVHVMIERAAAPRY
jgi:acetolactate synthase-1/2/3 large subunit